MSSSMGDRASGDRESLGSDGRHGVVTSATDRLTTVVASTVGTSTRKRPYTDVNQNPAPAEDGEAEDEEAEEDLDSASQETLRICSKCRESLPISSFITDMWACRECSLDGANEGDSPDNETEVDV